MEIRQLLKEKPWIGTVAALALIGGAVVVFLTAGTGNSVTLSDKAFYTVDDGKTYFVDDRALVAPFQHEGKEAVKVNMFSCDEGKTSIIGYLSKLSEADKKAYEAASTAVANSKGPPPMMPMSFLVKKPGGGTWYHSMSPEGRQMLNIDCASGYPEIVHP